MVLQQQCKQPDRINGINSINISFYFHDDSYIIFIFKNYFILLNAFKNKSIKYNYIKIYKGDVPEHIEVIRQTLKNQFELPIFFYFLVLFVILFDNFTQLDLIFAWIFVISRYLHCYIRLTSNYIRSRAKFFRIGFVTLVIWWIIFFFKNLIKFILNEIFSIFMLSY